MTSRPNSDRTCVETSRTEACEALADARGPAAALIVLLGELGDLLRDLSHRQYVTNPVGVSPSSVGAHIRHCLDHVRAVMSVGADGLLEYDCRERGTKIELDRDAALAEIDVLSSRLMTLSADVMSQPIRVRVRLSADSPPVVVASSFGRELAYVLSHTIHHNAIVAGIVKSLGVIPPDTFGYAPSTLRACRNGNARV